MVWDVRKVVGIGCEVVPTEEKFIPCTSRFPIRWQCSLPGCTNEWVATPWARMRTILPGCPRCKGRHGRDLPEAFAQEFVAMLKGDCQKGKLYHEQNTWGGKPPQDAQALQQWIQRNQHRKKHKIATAGCRIHCLWRCSICSKHWTCQPAHRYRQIKQRGCPHCGFRNSPTS